MSNYALSYNTSSLMYVQVNDAASIKTFSAMTGEATIYYNPASAANGEIIKKDGQYILRVNNSGNALQAFLWTSAVGELGVGITTLSTGQHHVGMSYDGSTLRLLLDGAVVASTAQTGTVTTSTNNLYFGADPAHTSEMFEGVIAEVRISNVARYTGSYTIPTNQFVSDANTVGLWHFSEGSGTTTADSSGNSNPGTLTGTPTPAWVQGLVPSPMSFFRTF